MRELIFAFFYVVALLALAFAVLRLVDNFRDRRRRNKRTPEERAAEQAAYLDRLLNPRWDEVISILGGRPSAALLAIYADRELIKRTGFSVSSSLADSEEEFIARFQPADAETLRDEWCAHLPAGSFPLAQDVTGDLIFVQLTASGADSPVMHWYHDGGDIEQVAASLELFHRACLESTEAIEGEAQPNQVPAAGPGPPFQCRSTVGFCGGPWRLMAGCVRIWRLLSRSMNDAPGGGTRS